MKILILLLLSLTSKSQTWEPMTAEAILKGDSSKEVTTYYWKQFSGPNKAILLTPDSANCKVTGLIGGIYKFVLMGINIYGTNYDTATVKVNQTYFLKQ